MDEYITIDGVPPSAVVREKLAAAGKPVLVSFSRGKDSLAAALALKDAGVETHLYHLSHIPGMPLITESLDYFREALDQPILDLPHPTFWNWINELAFQSPERAQVIEACDMPQMTYRAINIAVRDHYGVPQDTLCAIGVRAADSTFRRQALAQTGPYNKDRGTVQAVWDWRTEHIKVIMRRHNVRLPLDYKLFGRSFDGFDSRFLKPLAEHRPQDYEHILRWFPMARLELVR